MIPSGDEGKLDWSSKSENGTKCRKGLEKKRWRTKWLTKRENCWETYQKRDNSEPFLQGALVKVKARVSMKHFYLERDFFLNPLGKRNVQRSCLGQESLHVVLMWRKLSPKKESSEDFLIYRSSVVAKIFWGKPPTQLWIDLMVLEKADFLNTVSFKFSKVQCFNLCWHLLCLNV